MPPERAVLMLANVEHSKSERILQQIEEGIDELTLDDSPANSDELRAERRRAATFLRKHLSQMRQAQNNQSRPSRNSKSKPQKRPT
jgi:hypothetical protein